MIRAHSSVLWFTLALSIACTGAARPPAMPTAPPPPGVAASTPPLQFTKFLAFGDSLTEGLATPPSPDDSAPVTTRTYPHKLQAMLSATHGGQDFLVRNGGIGGEHAFQAEPRLLALLDEVQPEVVLIMEGVNDLNDLHGDLSKIGEAIAEVRKLLVAARSRQARVLVGTLPPQRPGGIRAYSPTLIAPFNAQLTALAQQLDLPVVDIYPNVSVDMLAPDGLHLTQLGNQRVAEAFYGAIERLFRSR